MQSHNTTKIITKNKFIKLVTIAIALLSSVTIHAQESCTQTLVDAQDVFSSGQIELVPEILASCLISGFNKQEKVTAYRLLTLCHLYYNHTNEASVTMKKMLKLNPEYKIQDIDPTEFINLHSTFRTTPILIIGIKSGIDGVNFYNTINYNDINSVGYAGTYTPNLAVLGGISIEAPIIKELSVVVEAYYKNSSYNFHKTMLEYATIDLKETSSGIEIPLLVQWNILHNKKLTPYVNAGTSIHYLLNSMATLTRKDTLKGGQSRDLALPQNIDLTDSRTSINFAATFGAGIRIKDVIGKGYLTFDIRYSKYFKYNVEEENRANNPSLTYSYMYTDNSFKSEDIQFLIGYKIPIYFPKQKKSARSE